jgi:MerR family transcriptional regulator, light-induced transcriptional regulator
MLTNCLFDGKFNLSKCERNRVNGEYMSPLPEVEIGNNEPLYNIGVVARMTGVSMATLRAWERRYDFPDSSRTSGGHRLYSEKDVIRLGWVKARIDEGMQTAQAIHALYHQEQTGHLVKPETYRPSPADTRLEGSPHLQLFSDRLLETLVRRDIQTADSVLGEALALSSPEELILNVIAPTFTRIGESWEVNQISVATEHLATNYLRQRLLMWMLSGPPPRQSNPIVLACAPEEWHEGSLLIVGALLRRRRWPVAYLGQAVPLPDLAAIVRDLQPPLVVLIAMTSTSAAHLVDWPHWMPEALRSGKPAIGYGGRIFTLEPEWRLRMSGVYLGDTLREGVEYIDQLLV